MVKAAVHHLEMMGLILEDLQILSDKQVSQCVSRYLGVDTWESWLTDFVNDFGLFCFSLMFLGTILIMCEYVEN